MFDKQIAALRQQINAAWDANDRAKADRLQNELHRYYVANANTAEAEAKDAGIMLQNTFSSLYKGDSATPYNWVETRNRYTLIKADYATYGDAGKYTLDDVVCEVSGIRAEPASICGLVKLTSSS